jgi:hypothetical protein
MTAITTAADVKYLFMMMNDGRQQHRPCQKGALADHGAAGSGHGAGTGGQTIEELRGRDQLAGHSVALAGDAESTRAYRRAGGRFESRGMLDVRTKVGKPADLCYDPAP